MSTKELLQYILELPPQDRIDLIDAVERSFTDVDVDALRGDAEIVALLETRVADSSDVVPWDEARRQIEERLHAISARR